jgi:hypothetical protein
MSRKKPCFPDTGFSTFLTWTVAIAGVVLELPILAFWLLREFKRGRFDGGHVLMSLLWIAFAFTPAALVDLVRRTVEGNSARKVEAKRPDVRATT